MTQSRPTLAQSQLRDVHSAVNALLAIAAGQFQHRFQTPEILFDLHTRAAGQYKYSDDGHLLRFNPALFVADFAHNLAETVPHEVAHYVTHLVFGRVQPHGKEWRAVMQLFGAEPEVTHNQSLDGIRIRRERRWEYRCNCRLHALTTRRHNRITAGKGVYLCRDCGTRLVFVE